MGKIWIILGFLAAFSLSVYGAGLVWQEMGDIELGFHGWAALFLGSAGTFGLGVGLMALSFYSHRRGYDEEAADHDEFFDQ